MHPIGRKAAKWTAELLLVFIGAYAAFWLNSYQERQRDAQRHDAILASLEQDVRDTIASAHDRAESIGKAAATFRARVDAGEMPELAPFVFITDYSPTDVAALLQSGGSELLDPKTLTALRKVESSVRGWVAEMARYEKLSDQLIVPNVEQDRDFFYDPATRKLRKRFAKYPDWIADAGKFFADLEKLETELLKQIELEQRKHR
ncbi:MAG TPA: hypothetical protein VH188_10890 [Chthoniobacterales bacterium]|jgi:hypothetical protein|nr:hypothetical protein [Chthoniobacterales bacterium]